MVTRITLWSYRSIPGYDLLTEDVAAYWLRMLGGELAAAANSATHDVTTAVVRMAANLAIQ